MPELPSLGTRGQGWVAIQVILLTAIGGAGLMLPAGWEGLAASAGGLAGWVLIAAGGALAVTALAVLEGGNALTAVPRPRDAARLVDSGPYRLVRHPIYGGLVLAAFGWGLVRASPAALTGALILLGFFDLKRRREEAWLRERFAGYPAYAARTRRMLPWLY